MYIYGERSNLHIAHITFTLFHRVTAFNIFFVFTSTETVEILFTPTRTFFLSDARVCVCTSITNQYTPYSIGTNNRNSRGEKTTSLSALVKQLGRVYMYIYCSAENTSRRKKCPLSRMNNSHLVSGSPLQRAVLS